MLYLEISQIRLHSREMVSSTRIRPVVHSRSHKSYEISEEQPLHSISPHHPPCPKCQPQQLSTFSNLWQIRMCIRRSYVYQCGCRHSGPIYQEYCGIYLDNLRRITTHRWWRPRDRYEVPECRRTHSSTRVLDRRCGSHGYTAWLEEELKMEQRRRERRGDLHRARGN